MEAGEQNSQEENASEKVTSIFDDAAVADASINDVSNEAESVSVQIEETNFVSSNSTEQVTADASLLASDVSPQDSAPEEEPEASGDESEKSEGPHRRPPAKTKGSWRAFNFDYATRVVLAFLLVTFLTVALSLIIVATFWGQVFSSYAANNIESLAQQISGRIAETYRKTFTLEDDALFPAEQAASSSEELGVIVVDTEGKKLYDSMSNLSPEDVARKGPSAATQIAIAPIVANGETVGTVRVWVYGSNMLMSKVDREFQQETYLAIVFAGLLSLLFALVVGGLVGRSFVRLINKLVQTTRDLSSGNLSARTGMTGQNELSRLGKMIDDMADAFERDRKLEKQLTSDVAHELRTPLMAIQANVEAMIDGVYERDNDHLELVDAEVTRLSRLVDALLKLSRLEMRSQPMREEVVNLSKLAEDVEHSHKLFVEESGLSVDLDVQPDVKVIGDEDMLKQAVANLLSNAIRYTDKGGSITIGVKSEGRLASISVADTGIGLTPEEKKMVFSRFWRADESRTKERGGLGIGLTLVKEIVDRHQGSVTVDGEKGVGAVFTLNLPLYDEERSLAEARLALRSLERRL